MGFFRELGKGVKGVERVARKTVKEAVRSIHTAGHVIDKVIDEGNRFMDKSGIGKYIGGGSRFGVGIGTSGASVHFQPTRDAPSIGVRTNSTGDAIMLVNQQPIMPLANKPSLLVEQKSNIDANSNANVNAKNNAKATNVSTVQTANQTANNENKPDLSDAHPAQAREYQRTLASFNLTNANTAKDEGKSRGKTRSTSKDKEKSVTPKKRTRKKVAEGGGSNYLIPKQQPRHPKKPEKPRAFPQRKSLRQNQPLIP